MHSLLERQIATAIRKAENTQKDPALFLLEMVSEAYEESDRVRNRLERSMEITSGEMQELHAETLLQKEAAEQANTAKSSFLATMSHEIRTPMNGILGFASILGNTTLDDGQKDAVKTISDSGRHLLSILNDILDLSKIETNALELEETDFEIEDVTNSCTSVFLAQAALKGLELSVYIDPVLPVSIQGDYGRVSQILNNLISNAVKFTESGTIGIEVLPTANSTAETPEIMFRVIDTGVGFSPEIHSHLFKEFTQADSSITRRFGGTGLGLSISKKLATLMGGNINAKSEEGTGSTFWFVIPFRPVLPPSSSIYSDSHISSLEGHKVLVVDDNAINRDFFGKQLTAHGLECTTVDSVARALEQLRDARAGGRQYDLAIIDHLMPEKDGFFLAREMRATPAYRHIPLILSSSAGAASLEYARSRGFNALAPKPVRHVQLLQTLHTLLNAETPAGCGRSPVNPAPETGTMASGQEILPCKVPSPSEKGYILIAEDNAINQKLIQMILLNAGYAVEIADNGEEAVAMVQEYDFDLVVMDVHMPKLSGRQATRAIRTLPLAASTIPILAATANAMSGDKEKCIESGMNDYIAKPFDADELVARIERLVSRPDGGTEAPAESSATTTEAYPRTRQQQDRFAAISWAI